MLLIARMEMWSVAAGVIIGGLVLGTLSAGLRFCLAGAKSYFGVGIVFIIVAMVAAAWIIDVKVLGHQWGHQ